MSPSYFEAWSAEDPPAGFADRVAATALGDEKRRLTRRAAFGFFAAACTALAAWKLDGVLHPYVAELTANVRTEVELAPGAIAILERGARLFWDRGGARQERGDVSYRLSPTASLKVETPLGSLRGRGSCCRVKLAEVAGQTTALLVSVAQGDLDVTHAMRHAALRAGQYARVTSLAIETEADDALGEIALELDLRPPQRSPKIEPESRDESTTPPLPKRAPERSPRSQPAVSGSSSAPSQPPSADAGARTVIVPSCFCDRGDSLCACFH